MKLQMLIAALFLGLPNVVSATEPNQSSPTDELHQTVAALDMAAFDAFNRCTDPAQLQKHAEHFAEDVEFYHDTGGVTWTRDEMLENTKKYVCGNFMRQLMAGTLKVFPIRGFGAISQGSHRFCQFSTGQCEGLADFTMVWRQKNGQWQITRVLSYGHRAASIGQ